MNISVVNTFNPKKAGTENSEILKMIEKEDLVAFRYLDNPNGSVNDIAALTDKTGRILGALMSIFVIMKALPLAYSKDLQEDKELTFDALDNFIISLKSMIAIIHSLKPNKKNLALAAGGKFSQKRRKAHLSRFLSP